MVGSTSAQPADKFLSDHLHRLPLAVRRSNHVQVVSTDGSGSWVVLNRDHSRGTSLQGFATHHAAAAAQVQPVAVIQPGAEDVHQSFPDPGSCWPGSLPSRAAQAPTSHQSQLASAHAGNGAPDRNHVSQRFSSRAPALADFSGWN